MSHHLRKTVASVLDDSNVAVRKISDQLGHSTITTAQDRCRERRLPHHRTVEILDDMFGADG